MISKESINKHLEHPIAMHTWRAKFSLVLLLTVSAGCVSYGQSPGGAPPRVAIQKVSENVFVLLAGNGLGSNVGVVVGDQSVVLIDSMNERTYAQLREAVQEITDKPVAFVINTHHHSDHTGGNSALVADGVHTIGHVNARYSEIAPELMVQSGFRLQVGDEELVVHHIAAHSYDDLIVHAKTSNALFMGDTFTNIWHPTGNVRGLAAQNAVIRRALELSDADSVIVPGHGYPDAKGGLLNYQARNERWNARIAELVRKGMTPEEMVSDPVLTDMRAQFVEKRHSPIMGNKQFLRFIQRTVSADFVVEFSMDMIALEAFTGRYETDEGDFIEVAVIEGALFSKKKGEFFEQLLALSPTSFHVRHSLGLRYTFDVQKSGAITSLKRHIGDESLQATRTLTTIQTPDSGHKVNQPPIAQ